MSIFNSINKKIFLIIFLSSLFIVIILTYIRFTTLKNSVLDSLNTKSLTISKFIEFNSIDFLINSDFSSILEYVPKAISSNTDIKYVIITKDKGTSIYITNSLWRELNEKQKKQIIIDKRTYDIRENILNKKEKVFHFNYPIVYSELKIGFISVGLSLDFYEHNIKEIIYNNIGIAVFMFLFSLLLFYFIKKVVVDPILLLSNETKKISKGLYPNKIELNQNDEIGQLADNFNYMNKTIQDNEIKIKEHNTRLKEKVIERTIKLKNLNDKLELKVKKEVLKRIQQEKIILEQARISEMGELIKNIAHQWRQPLNMISLSASAIKFQHQMNDLSEEILYREVDNIVDYSKKLSSVIDSFGAIIKDDEVRKKEPLPSIMNSILELFSFNTYSTNINIINKIDPDKYSSTYFNKSDLSKAIINIINNSIDIIEDKKITNNKIIISIKSFSEKIILTIEDNLGGIQKELINNVFDPYFTTKHKGQGVGLGLYVTHNIITENLNGKVYVRNKKNGVKFFIELPKSK